MASFIKSDLEFILEQILIAERHAAGENLLDILPNSLVPFGLRTVSGVFNNVVTGQEHFGAADTIFPRLLDPVFRTAEDNPFLAGIHLTSYAQTSGNVFDSQPRIISNLIADQTPNNPAAVITGFDPGPDGVLFDDPATPVDETADNVLKDGVQLVTSPGLDQII